MAMDMIYKGWGRDKIEQLLLSNGYRISQPPNYIRTTRARHELYYPNLIEGLELNNINQAIQTDITYYKVADKVYYMVFLIDIYSRRITGFAVNKTLEAEGNIKAINRMLATKKNESLIDMIHHSDKGSQYIDKKYLNILQHNKMQISMCSQAWENAYTERINRTIKEEYLNRWDIKDFSSLSRLVKKAVHHYNNKRRHQSLQWQTPVQFEKHVKKLPPNERVKLTLYKPL